MTPRVLAHPPEPRTDMQRRRVFKAGQILFNRRSSNRDCTICTMSECSGGVDVSSDVGLFK